MLPGVGKNSVLSGLLHWWTLAISEREVVASTFLSWAPRNCNASEPKDLESEVNVDLRVRHASVYPPTGGRICLRVWELGPIFLLTCTSILQGCVAFVASGLQESCPLSGSWSETQNCGTRTSREVCQSKMPETFFHQQTEVGKHEYLSPEKFTEGWDQEWTTSMDRTFFSKTRKTKETTWNITSWPGTSLFFSVQFQEFHYL